MSFLRQIMRHKANAIKVLIILSAVAMFAGAVIIYAGSQRVAHQQAIAAQQQVLNHTQTLNQINNIVTQLEKNNQVNHDTTIKYLQCIVQGLITSTPQTAQGSFNACLAVSGIIETK